MTVQCTRTKKRILVQRTPVPLFFLLLAVGSSGTVSFWGAQVGPFEVSPVWGLGSGAVAFC